MSRNKSEGKFLGKHKGRKVRYPKPMRGWLTVHGVAGATSHTPHSIDRILLIADYMVKAAALY